MTKHSKVRLVVGSVVATLALATIAVGALYAQQPPPKPGDKAAGGPGMMCGMGGGMMRGMMGGRGMMRGGRGFGALGMGLAQLNLTDPQKAQIKSIMQGHREQLQGLAAQGRQAGQALHEAVASGADETTIRARAADVAKVQADFAVFGAQVRKEVLGVLTPDQQAKAKELRLQFLDRAQKRIDRLKKMLQF